ncbi:MAG: purine-nucleoside phosphorylase [Anaerolineae bacterium]|nr:purine-nucleoside phosphorylase [Anaerolineae bacterium]
MTYSQEDYTRAVEVIRSRTTQTPRIGIVLGSGLGALAEEVESAVAVAYEDIPGFPRSTVFGHAGRLVIGQWVGGPVIMQQGRTHFYEGYSMEQVTFAIRLMRLLGVETVILTNAAGGVNKGFAVGDVMLIVDHINLVGMAGHNPLIGPNDERVGPRFIGMAQAYDRQLAALARRAAEAENVNLREGVYACVAGPNFETPAEIRMLRTIGADAVGMSTVHEVTAARHGGMRVLAFSGITNIGIDSLDVDADANHEEVLEAGKIIVPRMTAILRGVLAGIGQA